MPSPARPGIPHRTWRRRVARCFILYALVPYLSVIIIFTVLQRRLMYRPTVASTLKVDALQLNADHVSDVQLRTPDGATLNGWLLKPPEPAHLKDNSGLVIYFPGNAENRFHRIPRVDIPVTIYHGTADEMIPISEPRALAGAAGDDAIFVEIPNGEHNDIPMSLLRARLRELLPLNLN